MNGSLLSHQATSLSLILKLTGMNLVYRFLLVYMLNLLMLQNLLEPFQVVMIKDKWVALFHCYYKVMQKCLLNFPILYVATRGGQPLLY